MSEQRLLFQISRPQLGPELDAQQELAEFYRVEASLIPEPTLRLETDRSCSDKGRSLVCIFATRVRARLLITFARFDGTLCRGQAVLLLDGCARAGATSGR